MFNAEVCFGYGLRYDTCLASQTVRDEIEDFMLDNDLTAYFLGVSQNFKHFGFAVSVIILYEDATKIVLLIREEACYYRFTPANKDGRIDKVLYANWRKCVANRQDIAIPSLDIVLTPNGFGIVSSSNIAPASKQRVDRLVGSMLTHRDDCISALLPQLVGASKWLSSAQADYFGKTLFPTMEIVYSIGDVVGSRWDKDREMYPQIKDLEASLAEEWFSDRS